MRKPVVLCLLLVLGQFRVFYAQENKIRPNIIIILVDDAGYNDFNFMGESNLETPNIDKLASEGVIFTDAHVTSTVCAPSRAGLLTGRYQQQGGFECNSPPKGFGLDASLPTLGSIVQKKDTKPLPLENDTLGKLGSYTLTIWVFMSFMVF